MFAYELNWLSIVLLGMLNSLLGLRISLLSINICVILYNYRKPIIAYAVHDNLFSFDFHFLTECNQFHVSGNVYKPYPVFNLYSHSV